MAATTAGSSAKRPSRDGTGVHSTRLLGLLTPLLVLFTAILALVGCSRSPSGDFIVGLEAEPERLDPLTIRNPKGFILAWQVYEGLFGLDGAGRIAPSLAEAWETEDSARWRIKIRTNATFHPSPIFKTPTQTRTVTARDVVASYTAFCSATAYPAFLLTDSILGCADYNAGRSEDVDGIRLIDDHTVEIHLVKPEPFFLNKLTTPWIAIFPEELLEPQYEDVRGLDLVVGTGPYRMVSRTSSEIALERHTQHWQTGNQGNVAKLVFQVIANDEARLAALRHGGIDLIVLPPRMYPATLQPDGQVKLEYADDGLKAQTHTTYNSHMIGINTDMLTDVRLRRAMNFGIDRQLIVDRLLYGFADVTGGTIPPGIGGYVPPFDIGSLYDPEQAARELALSDYGGETLEMLVHDQASSEQIGQLFQSQMADIGIDIRLTKTDFSSAIARMVNGEVPLFSMFFDYVFSTPEQILLNVFTSEKRPAPNFWRFSDRGIDADIEALREGGPDTLKRSAEIERDIMEQVPGLFLYRLNQVVLYSDEYVGLHIDDHGHFEFNLLREVRTIE